MAVHASPLSLILVSALAGSAVALGAQALLAPAPGAVADASQLEHELAELRTKLARLADGNARLEERVRGVELGALSAALPAAAPQSLDAAPAVVAELRDQVSALAAVVDGQGGAGGAVALESVEQALSVIREREDRERQEREAQRRAERLDERLAELTQVLALDVGQQNRLRVLATDTEAARDALRDEIRETRDWESARAGFDKLSTDARAQLAAILMPHQLEAYDALDGDPLRLGGFGDWGGRGRDRGPGPGGTGGPSGAGN